MPSTQLFFTTFSKVDTWVIYISGSASASIVIGNNSRNGEQACRGVMSVQATLA
jgi:hypothetical protein